MAAIKQMSSNLFPLAEKYHQMKYVTKSELFALFNNFYFWQVMVLYYLDFLYLQSHFVRMCVFFSYYYYPFQLYTTSKSEKIKWKKDVTKNVCVNCFLFLLIF